MSADAGGDGNEHGARTLGTGVFLLLAGASIALLVISIPLGIAALVASAAAGVLAARKRTSVEGLSGGPVDSSDRLEGFIIDPLASGEAAPFDPPVARQQWRDDVDLALYPDQSERFEPPRGTHIDEVPRYGDDPAERDDEVARFEPSFEPSFEPGDELGSLAPFERGANDQLFFATDVEPAEQVSDVDFDLALAELAPLEDELERDRRIGHLRSTHAAAAEELNVALARWHQLVGDDADPYDPEPVIRAHDPQHEFDPRHVDASPTVRTVAAYHRSTQARWRVLWASLGADEVPDPAEVEDVLATMLAEHDAAASELAELEAARTRAEARAVLARPIVLVEPSAWISQSRLDQLLSSVPDETAVVLVEHAG